LHLALAAARASVRPLHIPTLGSEKIEFPASGKTPACARRSIAQREVVCVRIRSTITFIPYDAVPARVLQAAGFQVTARKFNLAVREASVLFRHADRAKEYLEQS